MKKHSLLGQGRTQTRRKVKKLRNQGMIPATIYGKGVTSESVVVSEKDFIKTLKEAGETGLIELAIDKAIKPVLIHHVQVDPVSGIILHIEFHQVDLKEKVVAGVPIRVIGESPAVAQKLGVLLTVLGEVEIEALPANLPEYISVDISSLIEVNTEVKVSDLQVPGDVVIQTDPGLTVLKIAALVTKEAETQKAAEDAASAALKTAEAPPEEAKPTEPTTEQE